MRVLRDLRKAKGISLKEFGKIIGVAESTVSLYENGKRQPDYDTLSKIADFFGVSTDYLLGRETKTVLTRRDEKEIKTIIIATSSSLQID